MTIYPDTSFLVSFLAGWERHHALAMAWFRPRSEAEWLISPWAEFETLNTLRQMCREPNGPPPNRVEAVRRYWRHLFRAGPFVRRPVDWLATMAGCQELSAAFSVRQRMRSADTLHIAILDQILPDLFVTSDDDQHALALARGFESEKYR